MAGWYHRLDGHEFEQAPGDSEGQGSVAHCSPWGCKEAGTTYNDKATAPPLKGIRALWEKVMILALGQEIYKMSLEHLGGLESMLVLKKLTNRKQIEKPL